MATRDTSYVLWKYPSMVKVKELTGHTQRVLYMAAFPDGRKVVSGAGTRLCDSGTFSRHRSSPRPATRDAAEKRSLGTNRSGK